MQLCPYDVYLAAVRRCDIALLPLEAGAFNEAKSDLKFIETAACGVAALASPTVYGHSIEDGATGLIYRSEEEFRSKLLRLLTDRPFVSFRQS